MGDFRKYRWLMISILGSIYFLACIHRVAPTVIARDLMEAFHADAATLGLIASAYFFLYSAVQPPVGILSDTIGPRKVIVLFTVISAAGGFLFAVASSASMAILGRALIGAGVGGIFIPSLTIFSRWYRADQFAGLTGTMLAIGSIGGISASLPLTYSVLLFGWRVSFGVIGSLALVSALICWMVVRNRPRDKGWPKIENGETQSPPEKQGRVQNITAFKRLSMVLSSFGFWMVTAASLFVGSAFLTFQGLWAVPYLVDVFGLSRARAGWLLMLLPVGFALGSVSFGMLINKFAMGRRRVLLYSTVICVVCWGSLIALNERSPYPVIIPLFLILGICVGGLLPILMTVVKELFPLWLTGTAVGLMNPAAFLGTALLQPFTGMLLDTTGTPESGAYPLLAYRLVFAVFLVSYIVAYLCTYLAFRKDSPSAAT